MSKLDTLPAKFWESHSLENSARQVAIITDRSIPFLDIYAIKTLSNPMLALLLSREDAPVDVLVKHADMSARFAETCAMNLAANIDVMDVAIPKLLHSFFYRTPAVDRIFERRPHLISVQSLLLLARSKDASKHLKREAAALLKKKAPLLAVLIE